MSTSLFAALPGKVKVLLDRLTDDRATNLDRLDANILSRASTSVVAKAATWTQTLADKINTNLDVKVSEVKALKKSVVLTAASGDWEVPSKLIGSVVRVSIIAGGSSGSFDGANDAAGGNSGEYLQNILYDLSSEGGTVSYVNGVGGAPKSTAGSGNDGQGSSFGAISVAGGKGGPQGSTAISRGGATGARLGSSFFAPASSPFGKFGGSPGQSNFEVAGGAAGLCFDDTQFRASGDNGDGYGAGGAGYLASANKPQSLAGKDGGIYLEWEETP